MKLNHLIVGTCVSTACALSAWAADADYWDPSEKKTKSVQGCVVVGATTRSLGEGWYSVDDEGVIIDGTLALAGDVNLILTDDATLTVNGGIAGEGCNLTVWGQEDQTGKLVVNGTNGVNGANATPKVHAIVTAGAGGTGGVAVVCAGLTIKGGTVQATGGNGGQGGTVDRNGLNSDTVVDYLLGAINGGRGGEGGRAVCGSVSFVHGWLVAAGGAGGTGGACSVDLSEFGEGPKPAFDDDLPKGADGAKGGDGKAFDRQPAVGDDALYVAAGMSPAAYTICSNTEGWEDWTCANIGSVVSKAQRDVVSVDASGVSRPAVSCALLSGGGFDSLEGGWYAVSGKEVTYSIGLRLAGDVNLILVDDTKLVVNGGISGEGSLTVWGQQKQTGALIVNGRDGCGGSVGKDGQSYASVWEQGGTAIDFEGKRGGGNGGAGSIGSEAIACVTLTINGGAVFAKGGNGGSGGNGGNGGSANGGVSTGVGFKGGAGGAGGQGGAGSAAISCENCNLKGGVLSVTAGQGGQGGQGGRGGAGGDGAITATLGEKFEPNGGDGGDGGSGGNGGVGGTAIIGPVMVSGGVLAGVGGDAGAAGFPGIGGSAGRGGVNHSQQVLYNPTPDDYKTFYGKDGAVGELGRMGRAGADGKSFGEVPTIETYERVMAENEAWNGSPALTSYKKVAIVASLPEEGTTVWNPWRVGATVRDSVSAYVSDGELVIRGSGAMKDFTPSDPAPWAASAASVTAVGLEPSVTQVGRNAFVALDDEVPVNGVKSSFYRMMSNAYGAIDPSEIAGSVGGAEPAVLEIVNGKAYLEVAVCTNAELTATAEGWGVATNGVIEVPAPGKQGFFILQSKSQKQQGKTK